ncbi:MAG: ABC transporter permease [Chloroflexi bacterium]|nr:ABC transporter permease [Chloroflexota bacterium]
MREWIAADLRGIFIIWYRDVLRFWRNRSRLLSSLGQPVLFLLVFGTGLSTSLRGAAGSLGGAPGYVYFLYPGVVAMAVLFTGTFSAMSTVWDREFGFLKEVLVAPVSRRGVAIGKALGGSTQAVLQGCIVLLLGPLIGVGLSPLLVVQMIALMFVLGFAMTSLGIAVASRVQTLEGFGVVVNLFTMPLFFLSGALFPLVGIPAWLAVLTRLDPATYGVDPLRRVVLQAIGVPPAAVAALGVEVLGHRLDTAEEVILLLAFALAMLALAAHWFERLE